MSRIINKININGKEYALKDGPASLQIKADKVIVNGEIVEQGLSGTVDIYFTGDVESIESDGPVTIHGNVRGNVDAGGSVACGDVEGSVDAGGSVACGNVHGDVDAGGSIQMKK